MLKPWRSAIGEVAWSPVISLLLVGGSVVTSALWIAICSAAPEFIWRGLLITIDHVDMADLWSALLIGLVLAFFVEPLMKRLEARIEQGRHPEAVHRKSRSALFAAGTGLVFAFASVCVHDAITAFVTGHDAGHYGGHVAQPSGLTEGIALAAAWAIVPFATVLAWMSVENRWLRAPLGIAAALSAGLAGWLFSWSGPEIVSTVVPCLLILGFGYWQLRLHPRQDNFVRCARGIAIIAPIWLFFAILVDLILDRANVSPFRLGGTANFWPDARFYLGWIAGLCLAPFPLANTDIDPAA